jgi:hypothetical protein
LPCPAPLWIKHGFSWACENRWSLHNIVTIRMDSCHCATKSMRRHPATGNDIQQKSRAIIRQTSKRIPNSSTRRSGLLSRWTITTKDLDPVALAFQKRRSASRKMCEYTVNNASFWG